MDDIHNPAAVPKKAYQTGGSHMSKRAVHTNVPPKVHVDEVSSHPRGVIDLQSQSKRKILVSKSDSRTAELVILGFMVVGGRNSGLKICVIDIDELIIRTKHSTTDHTLRQHSHSKRCHPHVPRLVHYTNGMGRMQRKERYTRLK